MKHIHNILKNSTEECVTCIFRPLILIGSYLGLIQEIGFCPHSQKYFDHIPKFQKSKFTFYSATITLICILIVTVYNIFDVISDFKKGSNIEIVFKLGLIIFQIDIISLYFVQLINGQQSVKEWNGFLSIITNKNNFGVATILDKKSKKYLNNYTRFAIFYSFIITLVITVLETYFLKNFGFWKIYNIISSCFYFFSQCIFSFYLILKCKLYTHALNTCYEEIKIILNNELDFILQDENMFVKEFIAHKIISAKKPISIQITKSLKKLQRLHCAIILNLQQLNNSLNPNPLIQILTHIIILILNYYLIANVWFLGRSTDLLILKQLETFGMLTGIVWVIAVYEDLYTPTEEIITFLEQFPGHKLKYEENIQVDMMLLTFRTIKPKITASTIFDIRIPLVASISATVLSYVLLGFQLRASWENK